MRGRDLTSLYAAAVSNVRQPHLDRLRHVGVMPATIARLGTAYPPFGVLTGQVEASGYFLPGEGQAHVVQPVVEDCALVDLVAWRVANPARWGLVNDLGWMLNADTCFASRWDGSRLSLCSTPLQWLRADAVARRALLGGAGIIAAIAASPVLASLPPVSAFDRRLAEWKAAFERFSIAANGENPDSVVNALCMQAGAAYDAMLAEPAPDAHAVAEKLHALILWTEGCVIPEEEVWLIGADAAAALKGER